eukprot:COSAG01_NODE_5012_length_4542_cov_18.007427_4_plen_178_part_00
MARTHTTGAHASAPNVAQTLASYKLQLELGAEGSDAELAARAEGGDLSARLLLAKKAFGQGDVSHRAHTPRPATWGGYLIVTAVSTSRIGVRAEAEWRRAAWCVGCTCGGGGGGGGARDDHAQCEAALDQALAVLKEDRDHDNGAPRDTLLTFFDALGPSHPLSLRGRRRMANLLYV